MKQSIRYVNRVLAVGAVGMGIASILMRDADKAPIYFVLGYILWIVR